MPRMRCVPTPRLPRSTISSTALSATFKVYLRRKLARKPVYSPRNSGLGKHVKISLAICLGNPVQWPPADVIIGNPPFLGSRFLAKERGYEYAQRIYSLTPEVPRMADYCVHWFRKAHDQL